MKTKLLLPLGFLLLSSLVACGNESVNLDFANDEYTIQSGDKINIENKASGVKYEIVKNPYKNDIQINEKTGEITFSDNIPNYTQIIVIARHEDKTSEPVYVTLTYEYQASEVTFTNKSNYIVNGEYINATSSKHYAVTYELKNEVEGISIESQTGKITYAPIVRNNTPFTIVADSHGSIVEKEFFTMTEGFVEAKSARQVLERGNKNIDAIYPLDFTKSDLGENGNVLAVVTSLNEPISNEYYSFDTKRDELTIKASYADNLNDGETTLKVITERNAIEIRFDVATKFISTADDLAAINKSEEALAGYYLLMNDIDLTSYLAKGGNGYNDGKGWTPIGLYTDTLDTAIATQFSFKGTFDGNGHVISNMYANRKDTASFNAGLFGYVTSSATIKNLGVTGELTVSSYSGGLVGSNSGIVENCWADVDMNVSSGEGAYRYVGGFAGNNFGTIKNSYSIGNVLCDRDYGSFVGSNEGSIENCYTTITDGCDKFIGYGSNPTKSKLFDSVDEMLTYNWEEVLPGSDWDYTAGLPTLKPTLEEFSVRGIALNIVEKVFKGENIDLKVDIFPYKFQEDYISEVEYEVEGDGFFRLGNYINTTNAIDDHVTIKVSLTVDGKTYTDEKVVYLFTKAESLTIEHNLTELEAGKRYLLEATCTPSDAVDPISYELIGKYVGAEIKDNILTIDDEFNLSEISFYAISESGVKSKTITIPVKKQLVVESGPSVVYENEDTNFTFTFANNLDLTDIKVRLYGKEIDYTLENNTITLSRSLLEDAKDSKTRVIFELKDGSIYGSDIYYLSHIRYNENTVGEDVIKIYSVEDFLNYFNSGATSQEDYDPNKVNNYDKSFILMADLDFGGRELIAIGYGDYGFSGKFYGNGHVISNFKILKNEKYFNNDDNSTSYLYGLGLFGSLDGEVYDLTIKDARIDGKNFCGGIAGIHKGKVENCRGINLKVYSSEYESSAYEESIYVGKIVGRNFTGSTLALYYDNMSINTVG